MGKVFRWTAEMDNTGSRLGVSVLSNFQLPVGISRFELYVFHFLY